MFLKEAKHFTAKTLRPRRGKKAEAEDIFATEGHGKEVEKGEEGFSEPDA